MTRTTHRVGLVGAALLLLLAGDAQAGVLVKLVSAGRKATLEFEGNKVRVEEEGNPRVVVFDGDAGRYLEIEDAARTWAVATRDDVIAAGQAFDARLRQRLAAADPEELRAWTERRNRLRQRIATMKATRFEPAGGQSMVADLMCDGFDEVVGGQVVSWGCYAPWSRKTFRKEDFIAFTRLAEFLNSGFGHVEAAQGLDLRDGPLGRLARAPGFPLLRLDLKDGGKSGVPFKVLAISHQPIPPERFRPPPGYTALEQPPSLALPVKAALPAEQERPGASPTPPPAAPR